MNITSANLAKAAAVAANLETLNTELATVSARQAELNELIGPLENEYHTLMGTVPNKAASPKRYVSPETKEKIRSKLVASWAARKAAVPAPVA